MNQLKIKSSKHEKSNKNHDLLYQKSYDIKNLSLAWKRLQTAINLPYKNFYRHLFLAYELNLDKNIKILHEKLKGNSYQPSDIMRFYIPKKSGLHRPISFLHLEDLIVYQAFGNVILDKFRNELESVQYKSVFSNKINSNDKRNIFLFDNWRTSYSLFKLQVKNLYEQGYKWVAHFDLAAYYDTINHSLLINQISPKNSYADFTKLFSDCLMTWSSHKNNKLGSGIPQGPVTSALVGEIYFLPIDKKMKKMNYIRYVDDIRIFSKTKQEAINNTIFLEHECKEMGLIPQSSKYRLFEAHSIEDALGDFPSLTIEEKEIINDSNIDVEDIFIEAFKEEKMNISKIKYILKTTGKNEKILKIILNNLNNFPDLVDYFTIYLKQYSDDENAINFFINSISTSPSPYSYVHGKYWDLLSYCNISKNKKDLLVKKALALLTETKTSNSPQLKWGIYKFLCSIKNGLITQWIIKEKFSLLQAFIASEIPLNKLKKEDRDLIIKEFIFRSLPEAGLSILYTCSELNLDIKEHDNPKKHQLINHFMGYNTNLDSLDLILKKRYNISSPFWKKFLDSSEYEHARNIICFAEKSFSIDKNAWINYIDSFLDLICRSLIKNLKIKFPKKNLPRLFESNGNITDIGVIYQFLIDMNKPGPGGNIKNIMKLFREIHNRRRNSPTSHAYDKKTSEKTRNLTKQEQIIMNKKYKDGMVFFIQEIDKLFIF